MESEVKPSTDTALRRYDVPRFQLRLISWLSAAEPTRLNIRPVGRAAIAAGVAPGTASAVVSSSEGPNDRLKAVLRWREWRQR